ncbi:uncharacterized protein ASCRUDRAFT_120949 [Ascoidea rubescens DSM 1968]|uniref:Nucleolar protein Dnt1-like N-terminal domain-containing protein n=1 Tax=Ascoidea rubescens DSM 1968 TaxID=1344418 RepID=A0A1D2VAE1_9ASCO|nr:hypothetical protein ASCRUDRAFT_120949 [Ascoidea rubescens DSM 1968]ODV58427.1 hypothetical protein ASCRUDRAFT_120949 [Ascoidea rubescens DSM 1968]
MFRLQVIVIPSNAFSDPQQISSSLNDSIQKSSYNHSLVHLYNALLPSGKNHLLSVANRQRPAISHWPDSSIKVYRKFLHLTNSYNSVLRLIFEIRERFFKLYPSDKEFSIHTVRDVQSNDIDPDYSVNQIFGNNNIIQIILNNELQSIDPRSIQPSPNTNGPNESNLSLKRKYFEQVTDSSEKITDSSEKITDSSEKITDSSEEKTDSSELPKNSSNLLQDYLNENAAVPNNQSKLLLPASNQKKLVSFSNNVEFENKSLHNINNSISRNKKQKKSDDSPIFIKKISSRDNSALSIANDLSNSKLKSLHQKDTIKNESNKSNNLEKISIPENPNEKNKMDNLTSSLKEIIPKKNDKSVRSLTQNQPEKNINNIEKKIDNTKDLKQNNINQKTKKNNTKNNINNNINNTNNTNNIENLEKENKAEKENKIERENKIKKEKEIEKPSKPNTYNDIKNLEQSKNTKKIANNDHTKTTKENINIEMAKKINKPKTTKKITNNKKTVNNTKTKNMKKSMSDNQITERNNDISIDVSSQEKSIDKIKAPKRLTRAKSTKIESKTTTHEKSVEPSAKTKQKTNTIGSDTTLTKKLRTKEKAKKSSPIKKEVLNKSKKKVDTLNTKSPLPINNLQSNLNLKKKQLENKSRQMRNPQNFINAMPFADTRLDYLNYSTFSLPFYSSSPQKAPDVNVLNKNLDSPSKGLNLGKNDDSSNDIDISFSDSFSSDNLMEDTLSEKSKNKISNKTFELELNDGNESSLKEQNHFLSFNENMALSDVSRIVAEKANEKMLKNFYMLFVDCENSKANNSVEVSPNKLKIKLDKYPLPKFNDKMNEKLENQLADSKGDKKIFTKIQKISKKPISFPNTINKANKKNSKPEISSPIKNKRNSTDKETSTKKAKTPKIGKIDKSKFKEFHPSPIPTSSPFKGLPSNFRRAIPTRLKVDLLLSSPTKYTRENKAGVNTKRLDLSKIKVKALNDLTDIASAKEDDTKIDDEKFQRLGADKFLDAKIAETILKGHNSKSPKNQKKDFNSKFKDLLRGS